MRSEMQKNECCELSGAELAAADLTRYRKDVAAKLLHELIGEQAAQRPETGPAPECSQRAR